MSAKPVFRRRQYLIKKGLQFRYIGIVFMLSILVSMLTGYTVFATGWTLLGEKLANVYPQGRLLYVFRAVNFTLARNLLLLSPLIFIMALLFSHRIAGPLYRIEKSVYEISRGNLALRVKIRKGDELWDLADLLNVMTGNFSNAVASSKDAAANIQKELSNIKKAISAQPYNQAQIETSIKNLQSKIEELNSSLGGWRTS